MPNKLMMFECGDPVLMGRHWFETLPLWDLKPRQIYETRGTPLACAKYPANIFTYLPLTR